jgi:hypothetical protein
MRRKILLLLVILLLATFADATAQTNPPSPEISFDFTNPKLTPPHWSIRLNPDGTGQFDAAAGAAPSGDQAGIAGGEVHRPIQLSPEFAAHAFNVARDRRWFNFECESHLNVAVQGAKRLSYSGPQGSGACTYNYSKDKEIQSLGDSLLAVESTLMYGARLEKLLQHDRLGLDEEMSNLSTAVQEGNAIELGVIRETLMRIANDDQVLDRARRRARKLLVEVN